MPKPKIVSLPPKRPEVSISPARKPQRFLSLRDVLGRLTISRSLLYELDPSKNLSHFGANSDSL